MPFDDFIDDEKTISAVRDQIMIIGEAVKHIPVEITEKYRETPWDEIAGMHKFSSGPMTDADRKAAPSQMMEEDMESV